MTDSRPVREIIPKELREEVFHKFDGHCAYCGTKLTKRFHVDHIIPVASGGVDDILNYFPACAKCNQFKNSMSLEDFRKTLEDQVLYKASFILAARFETITIHPKKIIFWYEKCGYIFDEGAVRKMMENNE